MNQRRSIDSFEDIHTHRPDCGPEAVRSLRAGLEEMPPAAQGGFYSLGLHPWDTEHGKEFGGILDYIRDTAAKDARVVAIGECGLDKHRGASPETQDKIFEAQAEIARQLGLPLIIHCVGAIDRLLRLRKSHPQGRWILHGFRGAPATARQLLGAGIELSFGERYNPGSLLLTPPAMRHRESD